MTKAEKVILRELQSILDKVQPGFKIVRPKTPPKGYQAPSFSGSDDSFRKYAPPTGKHSLPFRRYGEHYTVFIRRKWRPWQQPRAVTIAKNKRLIVRR